jgi:hypothetical protein
MLWLKKLQMRYQRYAGTKVLHSCNHLVYELLESDSDECNDARQKIQESIGNNCFDIIRKKGSKEIADFKKILIETVNGVFFPVLKKQIESFQQKLIGEVIS